MTWHHLISQQLRITSSTFQQHLCQQPLIICCRKTITMASLGCAKGASAARSFIRIAKRGCATAATQSSAPLEFLLPRAITKTNAHTAFPLHSSSHHLSTCYSIRKLAISYPGQQPQRRTFAITASRRATTCVLNPQTDEDGNEIMLEITPRAAKVHTHAMECAPGAMS